MAGMPGYIKLNDEQAPERDADGRVLGDVSHVRTHLVSSRGVSTVVVPPSTPGGTPQGFNPHDVDDVVINYDPGGAKAVSMTVRQLKVQQGVSGQHGRTIKTASGVSVGNVVAHTPSYVEEAQPQQPQQYMQPVASFPNTGFSPLATLQRANAAPEPVQRQLQRSQDKIVTFEVAGVGTLQAPYADIIQQGTMLILVFDHADGGKMCYFPDFGTVGEDTDPPDVALRVDSTGVVYMVVTTGVRFKHQSFEYCVLLITQTANEG